jgi:hypothetical protein
MTTPNESILYLETTIPAGLTIQEYRVCRPKSRRRRIVPRLRRR